MRAAGVVGGEPIDLAVGLIVQSPDPTATLTGPEDDNELRRGAGPAEGGGSRVFIRQTYAADREGLLNKLMQPDGSLRMYPAPTRQLAGERAYIPSLAIRETIGAGARMADPQGVPGFYMYEIEVAWGSRSTKILEVLVDEQGGSIAHVLMRRAVGR